MSIGTIILPSQGAPLGYSPFAAGPNASQFAASLQGAGFARFTFDFNQANLVTLMAGPIQAAPAPGAGFMWMPLFVATRLTRDVNAWTGSPALRLQFTGSVVSRIGPCTILLANGPGGTLDQLVWSSGLTTKTDVNNVTGDNLALEWQFATAATPGASVGTRLRIGLTLALVQLY